MLHNPYYIGVVTYRGMQYPGRHEPLISPELFERVQAILAAHNKAGERHRVHQHYLKGTVFCARCDARLTITNAKGKTGDLPVLPLPWPPPRRGLRPALPARRIRGRRGL